jgi:hypothetical protein
MTTDDDRAFARQLFAPATPEPEPEPEPKPDNDDDNQTDIAQAIRNIFGYYKSE